MIFRGVRLWMTLPWLQRRVLVRAAVWLGLMDLGLRTLGLHRLLERVPPVSDGASTDVPGHVGMYAAAIEIVAREYPVPAQCLHKSLVMHFWLRREGMPSQLRIGVRKEGNELKAHAWVELGGRVINDTPASITAFRPLAAARWDEIVWSARAALRPIGTGSIVSSSGVGGLRG